MVSTNPADERPAGRPPAVRGIRPFEARLATLRASKSPPCGCGHAHTAADGHAPSDTPRPEPSKGGP